MDKADWEKRLKQLKDIKKARLEDLEDMDVMIKAYEDKIASLKILG